MDVIVYPWQVYDLSNKTEFAELEKKIYISKYEDKVKQQKNIILTGAPGTGKTYLAKNIAKKLANGNDDYISFVQFHPSYDYSDFVEGLRPIKKGDTLGFELKNGIFKDFCKKALNDSKKNYIFIIDEINRGELSKIFGELFFSIDPNYRGKNGKVLTQYKNIQTEETQFCNDEDGTFFVPENVYIIGTMNDIDRSVESFDFAMRRRFTWIEVTADESAENMAISSELLKKMKAINAIISNIDGLGSSYHIGAAYFLNCNNNVEDYNNLWNYRLEPLIREYLRGMPNSIKELQKIKDAYNESDK